MRCQGCGGRCRAAGNLCRFCKRLFRARLKEADARGWIVDWAGGGVWVWNRRGDVLGSGDSKFQALAQALGEDA